MLKKIALALSITAGLANLAGCASIVSGTQQPVSVNTGNVSGAQCALQNNKGQWYVASTPGVAVVHRSYGDLTVKCQKPGYHGFTKVGSSTKGMAFGNAVFGGLIGAGVDVADGAAYDYPNDINVNMKHA